MAVSARSALSSPGLFCHSPCYRPCSRRYWAVRKPPAVTRSPGSKRSTDMANQTYIGDGVYVSFDGWQIWLRTERARRGGTK